MWEVVHSGNLKKKNNFFSLKRVVLEVPYENPGKCN